VQVTLMSCISCVLLRLAPTGCWLCRATRAPVALSMDPSGLPSGPGGEAMLKEVGISEDKLEWRPLAPTMAADLWQWLNQEPQPLAAAAATDQA